MGSSRHTNILLNELNAIIASSMDGFLLVSVAGNILEVNDSFCAMIGYSRKELLSMHLSALNAVDTVDEIARRIDVVVATGRLRFETKHRHKNGTIIDVEVCANYSPALGGTIVSFLRNVTERTTAERALRKSEERLRLLSDNLADGMVYQIDSGADCTTRKFSYISSAVERMHGLNREDVLRDPALIYRQVVEEHRLLLQEREEEAVRTMTTLDVDVMVKLPSGETRWRRFISTPHVDADGSVLWDGIEFDITEQRRVEEQLFQSQKLDSIGKLAGGIAHDFNNILQAISGLCDLAQLKLPADAPARQYIDQILGATDRGASLTKNLLLFSRNQATKPVDLDVRELIASFHSLLSRVLPADITLEIDCTGGLLRIHADAVQVEQILMNLCVNARDAMPQGGMLKIATSVKTLDARTAAKYGLASAGNYACISVSDTGSGIGDEIRERIFDPFFSTKAVGAGTGLGLSIVYGIVKKHHGAILLESVRDAGATFHVFFPLVNGSGADVPVDRATEAAPRRGTETILIAEDDPIVRKTTVALFREQGYRVMEAKDGGEAVRKFRDNADTINLVILDGVMPWKGGRQAFEEMLSIKRDLKVIFVSGYADNLINIRDLVNYGVAYLQKPVRAGVLVKKVRELLDAQ